MDDATKKLCTDATFATAHEFESIQYIKGGTLGEGINVNDDGGFDIDSISMFFSPFSARCLENRLMGDSDESVRKLRHG